MVYDISRNRLMELNRQGCRSIHVKPSSLIDKNRIEIFIGFQRIELTS